MCSVYLGNDERLYLNSFCFGYRLIDSVNAKPIYLSYYFRSHIGRTLMNKLAQGATRFNLSKTNLLKEYIALPPISEQQKIAEILTTWDKGIKQTKNLIEQLKLRKKGLMQQLLTGKKRLSGFSEIWKSKPLGSYITLSLRPQEKPINKYLALGLRSHGKGIFHKPNFDPKSIAMDTLYEVKENDLVVNITFAWEQAIAIADKKDEGGLVSHRFPTYVFNEGIADAMYFRYFVIQPRIKYLLGLISPGGAGRNRVMSKKDFPKLMVSIPPIEEQKSIANILTSADNEIKLQESNLESLQSQKKGLMQQLLTGKKRVTVN
jgi:type I restriction enzyme S subunit